MIFRLNRNEGLQVG